MDARTRRRGWALAAALFVVGPELAHRLAARRPPAGVDGRCRVLVLGFPSRADGSPGTVQRRRVEAAVELLRARRCGALILSGGNPHSSAVEADVMAGLAIELGVPREKIILERRARNTWENVANSLPLLSEDEHLLIVSDPLHARRARRYLCVQRPGACARAHAASRYRPFEQFGYKWLSFWHTLRSLASDALSGRIRAKP